MNVDELMQKAADMQVAAKELVSKVLPVMEPYDIPTTGVALSMIISTFLAQCEVSKPGSGKISRALLFAGSSNMEESIKQTIDGLKAQGVDVTKLLNTTH